MAERHDAQGFWQAEAGPVDPVPPVDANLSADILVVGGGYTGLWAAWYAKQLEPEAEVALVEADVCGGGPSGRNGGFVNALWLSLPSLRERFGDARALALARASDEAVEEVGRWCEEQRVDAWYRRGGYLMASTASAHDDAARAAVAACRELGQSGAARALDAAHTAALCASPRFRGGTFFAGAATVQPARLAHGLRRAVIDAGVHVFERSPARRVHRLGEAGVVAEVNGHEVRAPVVVLAAGPWLAGWRELRRRLTATTTHMVITEPVPDVLDELDWTGGECITDARAMVHYFRTTPDGRIAFGWGAGPVVPGGRVGGRADISRRVVGQVEEHLRWFFPQLAGRRIAHAWGGPVDVSPSHLPVVTELRRGRAFAAFGYTGNGVGPSNLVGRILASLALDRADELTRLAIVEPEALTVPPEPFRYAGGTLIRQALLRKERAEEAGRRPHPLTTFIADIPKRLGIHIGR